MYTKTTQNLKLPQWTFNDHPDFLTDINNAFEVIDTSYGEQGQVTAEMKENIQTLIVGMKTVEESLQEMQKVVDELGNLEDSPVITKIQQDISTLTENYNTLSTNVQANTTQLKSLSDHVNVIDSDINTLKNNISDINSNITTILGDITELQNSVDEAVKIANEAKDLAESATGGGGLTERVSNLEKSVSTIESQLSDVDKSIQNLTTAVTNIEKEISDIHVDMEGLQEGLSGLNKSIADTNEEVEALKTKVDNLENNQGDGSSEEVLLNLTVGRTLNQDMTYTFTSASDKAKIDAATKITMSIDVFRNGDDFYTEQIEFDLTKLGTNVNTVYIGKTFFIAEKLSKTSANESPIKFDIWFNRSTYTITISRPRYSAIAVSNGNYYFFWSTTTEAETYWFGRTINLVFSK